MRIKPNESYEDWARRVQQYEYGYALQRVAQGDPVEVVMEDMGRRIMQKLTHPLVMAIKEPRTSDFDVEQSRKNYEENYIKRYGPKPDHIKED